MAETPNLDRVVEMSALTEALNKAFKDMTPDQYPWPTSHHGGDTGRVRGSWPTPPKTRTSASAAQQALDRIRQAALPSARSQSVSTASANFSKQRQVVKHCRCWTNCRAVRVKALHSLKRLLRFSAWHKYRCQQDVHASQLQFAVVALATGGRPGARVPSASHSVDFCLYNLAQMTLSSPRLWRRGVTCNLRIRDQVWQANLTNRPDFAKHCMTVFVESNNRNLGMSAGSEEASGSSC